jgi:Zn-finger nucleic acid-binding protein
VLFEGRRSAARLLGCGACGGVWLDNEASRSVVEGAARDLETLAEQASAHAMAPLTPGGSPLLCPTCTGPLVRTPIAGTSIEIETCVAHGTWFDANELRLTALVFKKLPAPLRFSPADYANPADPSLFVKASMTPAQVQDRFEMLFPLFVFALIGAIFTGTFHVLSLVGVVITHAGAHFIAAIWVLLAFALSILAHYSLRNAHADGEGIAMTWREIERGLSRGEATSLLLLELYALVATFLSWPSGTDTITVTAPLSVVDARALWAASFLFAVSSVAMALSAMRVARDLARP